MRKLIYIKRGTNDSVVKINFIIWSHNAEQVFLGFNHNNLLIVVTLRA